MAGAKTVMMTPVHLNGPGWVLNSFDEDGGGVLNADRPVGIVEAFDMAVEWGGVEVFVALDVQEIAAWHRSDRRERRPYVRTQLLEYFQHLDAHMRLRKMLVAEGH